MMLMRASPHNHTHLYTSYGHRGTDAAPPNKSRVGVSQTSRATRGPVLPKLVLKLCARAPRRRRRTAARRARQLAHAEPA
eukprot:1839515-Prymnesium_polylepis.1